MKKTLALTALACLISAPVMAKTWVLTSADSATELGNWKVTSNMLKVKNQNFSIEQKSPSWR